MKRVFSGIQPTGNLHLGNYLGAIRNWVGMQDDYECIYCIVDLHALTVAPNPEELRKNIYEMTAAFIACGIDPDRSIIFPQSAVQAHTELAWILNCQTPLGWLNRMTQFKEKAGKKRDNAVLGLYAYPVLQAADILAYHATHVPVGEDQKQHIELSRDIAGAFNRAYDREFFTLPEPMIQKQAARIMSLRDGTKKMSKSDESEYSRINLMDDADTIALKFKKAKSDMHEGITYDVEGRPEASNLLQIYASLTDQTVEQTADQFASSSFSDFKSELADAAVAHLSPITQKMRELSEDQSAIQAVLEKGAEKARAIATPVMEEVREIIGLPSV
ncbi:MAG: tryptophan--tRNA ligase [Rickettsiales bacterium]|nr:tryptophan--tRNA ligase [Rickettsiales bacterium]